MTSSYGSAEESLRRIDDDITAAQERAARATAFRHDVEQLRGTGSSGRVTVTVNATGVLVDLKLPQNLVGSDGDRLRSDILAAQRAATDDAATQVRARAETTFGAESATTHQVTAELDRRLRP